jgi:hypothetical protein
MGGIGDDDDDSTLLSLIDSCARQLVKSRRFIYLFIFVVFLMDQLPGLVDVARYLDELSSIGGGTSSPIRWMRTCAASDWFQGR